jgi:hypothetical protein
VNAHAQTKLAAVATSELAGKKHAHEVKFLAGNDPRSLAKDDVIPLDIFFQDLRILTARCKVLATQLPFLAETPTEIQGENIV